MPQNDSPPEPAKNHDKSKVTALNLGQIGGKQVGATEVCSKHIARSDSVADSQDGLKCEQLQIAILAHPDHPLYTHLKDSGLPFFEAKEDIPKLPNSLIAEFTLFDLKTKCELYSTLSEPILLEAGHLCAGILCERLPNLAGVSASSFYSPTGKVELFLAKENYRSTLEQFFSTLDLTVHYVSRPKLAFTYPQVISMLVNEAHLALQDKLASASALDTAMKFGVNYPLGPIEWGNNIGRAPMVKLLDALFEATKDERYRVASELRG